MFGCRIYFSAPGYLLRSTSARITLQPRCDRNIKSFISGLLIAGCTQSCDSHRINLRLLVS
jgi:hypothetical protein